MWFTKLCTCVKCVSYKIIMVVCVYSCMCTLTGEKLHYAQVYPKLDLINIKHGQNLVGLKSSTPVHCILNHSFGITWHLFENNNTLIFGICELMMVKHKNSNARVLPPTVVIVGWSLNLSAGNVIEEQSLQWNQSFIPEKKILFI